MPASIRPCLILQQTLFGLAVVLCLLSLAAADQSSRDAKLRWRNGDEVFGNLLPQSGDRIRFSTTIFTEPFLLEKRQLDSLIFSEDDSSSAFTEISFEIFLKNGDQFRGELVTVAPDMITIRTPIFPDPVSFPPSMIRRIVRVSGPGRAWIGPDGLSRLTSIGRDRKPLDWKEGISGSLTTHQWLGNFFRAIDLPTQAEVRFQISFPDGSPDFEVGLLRSPEYGPMLETWNHRLVLSFGNHFASALDLSPGVQDLTLRLFWNQETGETRLCDIEGRTLASLRGEKITEDADPRDRQETSPFERGFYMLSRNVTMTLHYLHVFEWDGKTIPEIQTDSPRIHWRTGASWKNLTDLKLAAGESVLHHGSESRNLSDLIEWSYPQTTDEPIASPTAETVHILWPEGISVGGRCLSITPAEVILQPDWSDSPVTVNLKDAKSLRFHNPGVPIARGGDLLSSDSARMRGTLHLAPDASASSDPGDSFLAWQAVGADSPVPFARKIPFSVSRPALSGTGSTSTGAFTQSRIHTNTDEILTGELVSLTPDRAVFSSPITGEIQIASADWRGVDLGWTGRIFQGFRDPAWHASDGNQDRVTMTPTVVTMETGAITNPSLLIGDRIDFDLNGGGGTINVLRLRLFLSETDPAAPSIDIDFSIRGNIVSVGRVTDATGRGFSGRDAKLDEKHNHITVSILSNQIEVFLNGKFLADFPNTPSLRSGNGIRFQKYPVDGVPNSTLRLAHFQIDSQSHSLFDPILDSRTRRDLFTIPRSQRKRPPTHLLIGMNGDILRGGLESFSQGMISFETEGKKLLLPRARVARLVRCDSPLSAHESTSLTSSPPSQHLARPIVMAERVDDPDDDSQLSVKQDQLRQENRRRRLSKYNFEVSHNLILRDGTRLHLLGKKIDGKDFIGDSAVLGQCKVSLEQLSRLVYLPPSPLVEADALGPTAFEDWQLFEAPEPHIQGEDGPPESPLTGKLAPSFDLTSLGGEKFSLSQQKGKIVVLEFWATWNRDCVKMLPEVESAIAAFPPGAVVHLAINQGESPVLVNQFLETRNWQNKPVAIDSNQTVGRLFAVDRIPYLVVIRPDGTISWIHSGSVEHIGEALFRALTTAGKSK